MEYGKTQTNEVSALRSGVRHEALAASTLKTFTAGEYPRFIHCQAAGTLEMTDHNDDAVSWTVLAGQDIFFAPKTITTNTDIATVIVW